MSIRVTSCVALTLALLAPAAARGDDTYDLRAKVGRKSTVGERYRLTEDEVGKMEQSVTRNGQAMPGPKRDSSWTRTVVEEIEAVGADGAATKKKRTYEAFKDESGADVPVTGVVVVLTRAEGDKGHWSFAPAEGSAAVPEQVTRVLEREMKGENERVDKGATEAKINEAMFPAEPQAAGATWPVDLAKAAPVIGLDVEDVDLETSKATGTVTGVEEKGGKRWVKAKVTMNLMLKKMQGRPAPQPIPMELTFDFAVPTDDCVDRDFHMTQHLDMTMSPQPGVSAHVLVHNERNERRATP